MMNQYPRARKETSAPPSLEEISKILREQWGYTTVDIQPIGSKKVHFVNLPNDKVVFRANPGWDASMPPAVIVKFVDYLSKKCAPVPKVITTQTGERNTQLRDWTLSVESKLPGKNMSQHPIRFLDAVGKALARIHNTAEHFPDCRGKMKPVHAYIQTMFQRTLTRPLEKDELRAIEKLQKIIINGFSDKRELKILWILCHNDVANINTMATEQGEIGFIDFDSAEYAPALLDIVMTRFQWLRHHMNLSDAAHLLSGYNTERPLCESEILAFPFMWAAYHANRMAFLLERRRKQKNRSEEERQKYRNLVLQLPNEAMPMAHDLLKASGLNS